MKEARPIWESLYEESVEVSIEDKKATILRKDYEQLASSDLRDPILRLLPSFDPYLLGHADKNHLVDSSHYKRIYRNQGWISPVALLNGRVIGIWSHTRGGRELSLEVPPFEKLSRIIQAKIEQEAASLGAFLESQHVVNKLAMPR